jgi:hypothetical protein
LAVALQAVVWYVPAAHTVHATGCAAPPKQYESSGQGVTAELPLPVQNEPAGQGAQDRALDTVLKVPGAHVVHVLSARGVQLEAAYFPGVQAVHAWQTVSVVEVQLDATSAPVHAEQSWGAMVPPTQKRPLGHAMIELLPG